MLDLSSADSERLGYQILHAEGYRQIDPTHPSGGPDGQKDAIAERDGRRYVMACYFPLGARDFPSTQAKFVSDLRGVTANGATGFAFVTNQKITDGERKRLTTLACPAVVDIFHLERVTNILDRPEMASVRRQFLEIPLLDPLGLDEFAAQLMATHREATHVLGQKIDQLYAAVDASRDADRPLVVPPHLVEALREAELHGPPLAAIRSLVARCDRGEIVATVGRWSQRPPTWLVHGSGHAWAVLAEVVSVYGDAEQVVAAISRALSESSPHYGYWRGMLLLHLLDTAGGQAARVAAARFPLSPTPHPLEVVAAAAIGDHTMEALQVAEAWAPDAGRERDLRALLIARGRLALDEPDRAIRVLEERVSASESAGLRVALSRQLTWRAYLGRSPSRDGDLARAVRVAIEARDRQRSWRLDSADAVLAATDAEELRTDWPGAWRLVRPSPDGEATADEAADRSVRARAAHIAALLGQTQTALDLAADISPFELALIQASIADLDDTAPTVVEPPQTAAHGVADPPAAWRRVWELAGSEHERIQAARGLARVGVRDVDGLKELLVATPELAAEFDQLAQLAPRPGERPSAVRARLRAQRRQSLLAATRLAELLMGDGQAEDAADVLAEAADVFDDQQLRLAAASMLRHAGHRDAAAEQARDALSRSSSTWSGRRQARQILHDAAVEAGRWADSAQLARTLLADDPADEMSRWCLVSALCQQGRFDEAWSAVLDAPSALEARDLRSMVLLLELTARFGDQVALWTLAADLVCTHLDDERLAARALVLAYVPPTNAENVDRVAHDPVAHDPGAPDLNDGAVGDALAALHRATGAFTARYPKSAYFRQVRVDPEQPQAVLEALAAEGHRGRSQLIEQIIATEAPLGMLASVAGRSYAEIILLNGAGHRPLRSPITAERALERDAAEQALQRATTVIDAAGLHTISLLQALPQVGPDPCPVVPALLGAARSVVVTDLALHDLISARDSTSLRSTASVGYDDDREQVIIHELSAAAVAQVAERAAAMLAAAHDLPMIAATLGQDPHRTPIRNSGAWLGQVEFCKATGHVLWSDDLGLRRLARSEGVSAFGTFSLLEQLLSTAEIEDSDYTALLIHLSRHYMVDLPIDLQRLRFVALAEQWTAGSAAMTLSRKWTWIKAPSDCEQLFREALDHNASNPSQLRLWSRDAACGLARLDAGREIDQRNLAVLLGHLLQARNLSPAGLAAAVAGVHDGAPQWFSEAWSAALRDAHRRLLESGMDWPSASAHLRQLTSSLSYESRIPVVATIVRLRP